MMPRAKAATPQMSGHAKSAERSDDAQVDRQGVQVLMRAGQIMRVLKLSPGGLSQVELATTLDLARTTVHRLLNALAKEGLVEACGTAGRYRLGPEILQMADAARSAVISDAHPVLQRLSSEIKETVDLSLLDRGRAAFVDQVVAPQRLRAVSAVGGRFPLYCTANGKAILSELSHAEANRVLPEQLDALTINTITSKQRLWEEIDRVRSSGLSTDQEEHSMGISAVGISLGITKLGYAAISVPIPTSRFENKRDLAGACLRNAVADMRAVLCR